MPKLRPTTYAFRAEFGAPVSYAYRWCTDYTSDDPRLAKESYVRRIIRRSSRHVTYEDLEEVPEGWHWSHSEISLTPPNRWHAEITGSHRDWTIDYTLRALPNDRSELLFRGRRTPTEVGGPNPGRVELTAELRTLWTNYGSALDRDYRTTLKRREKNR